MCAECLCKLTPVASSPSGPPFLHQLKAVLVNDRPRALPRWLRRTTRGRAILIRAPLIAAAAAVPVALALTDNSAIIVHLHEGQTAVSRPPPDVSSSSKHTVQTASAAVQGRHSLLPRSPSCANVHQHILK